MTPVDPTPVLVLHRETHLLAADRPLMDQLRQKSRPLRLAADQIHHPAVPGECLVRLGKIRISQFLPDGREITRAVLQAGAAFVTRAAPAGGADPLADVYCLPEMVIMALAEAELWELPAGTMKP